MISIIVAIARNGAIGQNNGLLCHLPNDLKRFKALTSEHTVIMGRKTFESLPNGALPNRRNIVISKTVKELPNCECVDSLEKALSLCPPEEEAFIIGGATVYEQSLPFAAKLYITWINHDFPDADTFLPVDLSQWKAVKREDMPPDEKHKFSYSFVDYEKQ
ncbi:MAG: dihydrofolate reductase [Prevotellaceae bacterium]|nr:dihydrofolate reductase [Prevotellaceae bacterium]